MSKKNVGNIYCIVREGKSYIVDWFSGSWDEYKQKNMEEIKRDKWKILRGQGWTGVTECGADVWFSSIEMMKNGWYGTRLKGQVSREGSHRLYVSNENSNKDLIWAMNGCLSLLVQGGIAKEFGYSKEEQEELFSYGG